jgi:hypothetical protein
MRLIVFVFFLSFACCQSDSIDDLLPSAAELGLEPSAAGGSGPEVCDTFSSCKDQIGASLPTWFGDCEANPQRDEVEARFAEVLEQAWNCSPVHLSVNKAQMAAVRLGDVISTWRSCLGPAARRSIAAIHSTSLKINDCFGALVNSTLSIRRNSTKSDRVVSAMLELRSVKLQKLLQQDIVYLKSFFRKCQELVCRQVVAAYLVRIQRMKRQLRSEIFPEPHRVAVYFEKPASDARDNAFMMQVAVGLWNASKSHGFSFSPNWTTSDFSLALESYMKSIAVNASLCNRVRECLVKWTGNGPGKDVFKLVKLLDQASYVGAIASYQHCQSEECSTRINNVLREFRGVIQSVLMQHNAILTPFYYTGQYGPIVFTLVGVTCFVTLLSLITMFAGLVAFRSAKVHKLKFVVVCMCAISYSFFAGALILSWQSSIGMIFDRQHYLLYKVFFSWAALLLLTTVTLFSFELVDAVHSEVLMSSPAVMWAIRLVHLAVFLGVMASTIVFTVIFSQYFDTDVVEFIFVSLRMGFFALLVVFFIVMATHYFVILQRANESQRKVAQWFFIGALVLLGLAIASLILYCLVFYSPILPPVYMPEIVEALLLLFLGCFILAICFISFFVSRETKANNLKVPLIEKHEGKTPPSQYEI